MRPYYHPMRPLLSCVFLILLAACAEAPAPAVEKAVVAQPVVVKKFGAGTGDNELSEAEAAEGFMLLFDGENADTHFKGYDRSVFPYGGWKVRDGVLVLENPGETGGDLITKAQYDNFDLRLDFALTETANTGIFYLAPEVAGAPIWNNAPEYQLLDDPTYMKVQGADMMTSKLTGDVFGLYDGNPGNFRPDGQWNSARIVHQDGVVTHYLNGKQTLQYTIGDNAWDELIAGTKFKAYPDFGRAERGHIGLQDHGQVAYFKNIRIKAL